MVLLLTHLEQLGLRVNRTKSVDFLVITDYLVSIVVMGVR